MCSFKFFGSRVAYLIINRLVPNPARFENRQLSFIDAGHMGDVVFIIGSSNWFVAKTHFKAVSNQN